ncbi:glutamate--tRNA ligase [Natroniella acetigena]|uniref:glutamate--tRNA ligase n=1 Tax=Natroniella acetigena TaxID=52004 RepID=UPI00200A73A0|nr:glutamate--tRNA ligase [Natroniella acetigena]MCK8827992.1 glutamate--tRNA ligase [Natroniella acetigena]
MSDIRVRFAPSPTGQIHIGNIRTALFNYLFAKKNNGTFILRVEDTDQERSTSEFEEVIQQEMNWLGLNWDEGVQVGGDYGPYRQMERLELYQEYIQQLLEQDLAYRCYCTPEELEEMREKQRQNDEAPRYTGKCRSLTAVEKEELEAEGRKPVIRFKVPHQEQEIIVKDLVKGDVSFSSEVIDDFVLVKSDEIPTYNFAVVIDDHLMEISHVIRGEDHLSNTPKQQLLFDALDWEAPQFAHLSMILGADKSKLSKRSGEAYVYVSQYREKGYLPEALINFLALLGWSPDSEDELFTQEEIIEQFSLAGVAKSPAVFDVEKLNWMNGMYIRNADLEQIVALATPYLEEAGCDLEDKSKEWIELVIDTVRGSIDYIAEITEQVALFFGDVEYEDYDQVVETFREEQVDLVLKTLKEKVVSLDSLTPQTAKEMLKEAMNELPVGGRLFYHPLRFALTGQGSGPELYNIIAILGEEEVINRLDKALALI